MPATIVALMPDYDSASQVVPKLGQLGLSRDAIHVATGDRRGVARFSEPLGLTGFNLKDGSNPTAELLNDHLPASRMLYFKQRLQGKRVLFALPNVSNGDQVAHIFQEAGADFGPPAMESEAKKLEMPLRSEKLDVQKYTVQSGKVKMYKEIVTEVERYEVELKREELVIECTPADADSETKVTRIPLQHEEVSVSKRTLVTNEVSLRREQHEETMQIEEPVRSERLRIATEGDVILHHDDGR